MEVTMTASVQQQTDNSKISLSEEDFELLLPGKIITVGKSEIVIKPLGTEMLKLMFQRLGAIAGTLKEAGITFKNYNKEDQLFKLVEVIMDKAPSLLSDASNIEIADLQRLPVMTNVQILTDVLEINIESQEGLEKNLHVLAGMIGRLKAVTLDGELPPAEEVSAQSSKGLLKKATLGKKSKGTRRVK